MSLRDFWTSVRTGASFLLPTVTADSPKVDAHQIEARLRNAHVWLTPKSVEGFDEQDFDFLAEDTQKRLTQCVNQFRDAAGQVPSDQPATEFQVQAALPAFLCVLDIMRPDRYGDLDAFVIGKQVEEQLAGELPDFVCEMRFETGEDANGDPALWVWIDLDDTSVSDELFPKRTREVRQLIVECLRRMKIQRWPYVRFRRSSEREQAAEATGR